MQRDINPLFGADKSAVNISSKRSREANINAKAIGQSDTTGMKSILGAATQGYATKLKADQVIEQRNKIVENANRQKDAQQAKNNYYSIITSKEYMDASDTQKAELMENSFKEASSRSEVYQEAYKQYTANEYMRVYKGRNTETNNSIYNVASADYKAWSNQDNNNYDEMGNLISKTKNTPEEYVNHMKKVYPTIDKVVIGRALMLGSLEDKMVMIKQARNPEELKQAQEAIKEIDSEYKSPLFLNNKSKQGKELVTAMNTKLNKALADKNKEFILASQTKIATALDSYESSTDMGVPPFSLMKDIDTAYPNPISKQKITEELENKYQAQNVRVSFLSKNGNIYTPREGKDLIVPKEAKKEYTNIVTTSLLDDFNKGSYSKFISGTNNNIGYTKDFAASLSSMFYGAKTTKDLEGIINKVDDIIHLPGGATSLYASLNPKLITEMVVMKASKGMFGEDLAKVRDAFNKAASIPNSDIAWDKANQRQKRMYDNARKLGILGTSYVSAVKLAVKMNPAVQKQTIDTLYEYYTNLQHTVGDKNINASSGADVISNNIPSSKQEKVYKQLTYTVGDDSTVGYTWLSNGIVVPTDNLGMAVGVPINGYKFTEIANKEILQEAKERTNTSEPVGEIVTGRMINEIEDATTTAKNETKRIGKLSTTDKASNVLRDVITTPMSITISAISKAIHSISLLMQPTQAAVSTTIDNISSENNINKTELTKSLIDVLDMKGDYTAMKDNIEKDDFFEATKEASINNANMFKNILGDIKSNELDVYKDINDTVAYVEGGYQTLKNDGGNYNSKGELIGTNYGVSGRMYEKYIGHPPTKDEMENMTEYQAQEVMTKHFYKPYRIKELPRNVQGIVAASLINAPAYTSRALRKLLHLKDSPIFTKALMDKFTSARFTKKEFADAMKEQYNKSKSKYKQGWINRVDRLYTYTAEQDGE